MTMQNQNKACETETIYFIEKWIQLADYNQTYNYSYPHSKTYY